MMFLIIILLCLSVCLNHALAPPLMKIRNPKRSWISNYHPSPIATHERRVDIIKMVRGGDIEDNDTTDDESEEYDVSSDEEEETDSDDEEEDTTSNDEPPSQDIEKALQYNQLSSQSRNFGIMTALWGSLFFDSILNTAKRAELFPVVESASTSLVATLVPTTSLATGFGLAATVSFLLWRDMESRADVLMSDDGTSSKGDWFLSLSSKSNDENEKEIEQFASKTRTRLYLHLSMFGLLSLMAHAGYYYSRSAPFLGMSAAIINIHNTLACISALIKETDGGLVGGLKKLVSWPMSLFQSKKGEIEKLGLSAFVFRIGSVAALMQCIPICRLIALQVTSLATEASTSAARLLCLKVAALARLSLIAGVSHTIYTSFKTVGEESSRHPFFAALSGMLGLGSLSVAGSLIFDALVNNNAAQSGLLGSGFVLVVFGLTALWNSVLGVLSSLPKEAAES